MDNLVQIMPLRLREKMAVSLKNPNIEEIRIRIGQPIELRCREKDLWLGEKILAEDIEEMLTFISKYSIYAYEEEIRQGFLTIDGGHRIGFAGQVRLLEGKISHMVNIRFLNIRVAREKKGCALEMLPWIYREGEFYNTLLVSPPGVGKTTYLRDCIRQISGEKEKGKKICVIDERSEIAACHLGIPQNDLGVRTDVIDGCPKSEGMMLALRSMSPDIIAVDELGGEEDAAVIRQIALSGCQIFGTVHGRELSDIKRKHALRTCFEEKIFQRYIFLKKDDRGKRSFAVFDQELENIC
ncbi:MAG: stage III sporulation protein AA [Roseburia sp.]|nr:stage III sporulation protein AA [Roseburia sp.]